MSEPLDLEAIKARLAAASTDLWDEGSFRGGYLKPWARDIVVNAPFDLAALVAEVERLRAKVDSQEREWPAVYRNGGLSREADLVPLLDDADLLGLFPGDVSLEAVVAALAEHVKRS